MIVFIRLREEETFMWLILIPLFIVIFIFTHTVEKTLKTMKKQNDEIIVLLNEIKEQNKK